MDGNYCIRMYLNGFDCSMTEYDWVARLDSRLVLPSAFLQMSQTEAQRAVMNRKRSSEFHPLPLFRHHHRPARGTDFTWCTHSCHILSLYSTGLTGTARYLILYICLILLATWELKESRWECWWRSNKIELTLVSTRHRAALGRTLQDLVMNPKMRKKSRWTTQVVTLWCWSETSSAR